MVEEKSRPPECPDCGEEALVLVNPALHLFRCKECGKKLYWVEGEAGKPQRRTGSNMRPKVKRSIFETLEDAWDKSPKHIRIGGLTVVAILLSVWVIARITAPDSITELPTTLAGRANAVGQAYLKNDTEMLCVLAQPQTADNARLWFRSLGSVDSVIATGEKDVLTEVLVSDYNSGLGVVKITAGGRQLLSYWSLSPGGVWQLDGTRCLKTVERDRAQLH